MTAIPLKCQCGAVTGEVRNVTPKYGSRLVCHCSSCQAFANHIGAGEPTLDAQGGSDIYQTNPAQITFDTGAEHLKCLRLTPKGTIRWYTGCCQTPIGNTVSVKFPFIGMITTIMGEGWEAILVWKLTGKTRPNPFFEKNGNPVSEPEIVNPA